MKYLKLYESFSVGSEVWVVISKDDEYILSKITHELRKSSKSHFIHKDEIQMEDILISHDKEGAEKNLDDSQFIVDEYVWTKDGKETSTRSLDYRKYTTKRLFMGLMDFDKHDLNI